jgi:quinol monooxygenase YgiN
MAELALSAWIAVPAAEQRPLLDRHLRLTRAEPGCLAFPVTPVSGHPERLGVAERSRDRDTFEAPRHRSAASAWGEATRHLDRSHRIEGER